MKTVNATMVIMVLLGVVCLCAGTADAIIVDLDHIEVGTVVAGMTPDGAILTRNQFEDFSLAVDNNGEGPNSLVVCNYLVPNPRDNGYHLGDDHIMLIPRNVIDTTPVDGLVDEPLYENMGGIVDIQFHAPVNMAYVLLNAVEPTGYGAKLVVDGVLTTSVSDGAQWQEPGIFIDLDGYQSVNTLQLRLSGGIGIARIAYFPESVAVETAAWGAVKALYR